MIGPHRLRLKLEAKEPALGLIVNFPSAWFVDMAAVMGFDFVLIDAEHGPLTAQSAEIMIRAAEAANISPIVRVPANLPHEILRYLDIGATGIQIPHVENAVQAAAAVSAIRYPPEGERGLAAITRAAGYGIDIPVRDYMALANREVLCLPMVETALAAANIDEIAATEGVDAVIIGPGDLSASMGYAGDRTHPEVKATVSNIIKRTKSKGRWVSFSANEPEAVREAIAAGANMIQVASTALLARTGRDFVNRCLSSS